MEQIFRKFQIAMFLAQKQKQTKNEAQNQQYPKFPPNDLPKIYFIIQILVRYLYTTKFSNMRNFDAVLTFKPGVLRNSENRALVNHLA